MRTTIVALAFGLSSVSALPTGPARRDSGNTTSPDADLCTLTGSCTIDSAAVPSASSVVPSASISESAASTSVVIPCPASTAQPSNPDTDDGSGSLSIFDGFKRWVGLSNGDADETSASAEASCGTAGGSVPTNATATAATVAASSPASISLALAPSASPVLNASGHLGVFSGFKRRARLSNRDADTDESSAPGTTSDVSIKKDPEFIPAWRRDVFGGIKRPEIIAGWDRDVQDDVQDAVERLVPHDTPLDIHGGIRRESAVMTGVMPGWKRDVHDAVARRDVDGLDAFPIDDSDALPSESTVVPLEPTSTPTFADYASSVSTSAVPADNLEDISSLGFAAPGSDRRGVRAQGSSRKVRRDV